MLFQMQKFSFLHLKHPQELHLKHEVAFQQLQFYLHYHYRELKPAPYLSCLEIHNQDIDCKLEKLIHPEYNYLNPPKYDFVLARLNGYSKFKPARIDVGGHDLLDSKAEVTTLGWGKSTKGGAYATTLKMQEGQLNLMSNEDCRRSWWGGQISDEMICAYDDEVNTCVGDSGGPLVYYDEDDTDRENPTLVGVVSWGSGSCAYATVYANVAHEYKWILTNANAWSNGELCYNYRSSDDCDADDMCSWQEGECHSNESQIS